MLDINLIRENPGKVKQGIEKRNLNPKLVDDFLGVDEEWRSAVAKIDELRKEQNELTEKLSRQQDDGLIEKARELKEKINELEVEKDTLDKKRAELLYSLPNLPFPDVPVGKDEKDNKVLREIGEKRKFDFEPKDYLTIAENLDLVDMVRAAKASGTRFGYIKGDLVRLHFALLKLAFDVLTPQDFIPVLPPVLIKKEMMKAMGYMDTREDEEERYCLEKDNMVLVGTSEQSIGPMHKDEVFEESALPKRYVAYSSCFRREAGSYGKDTKGILRVHQFEKTEMFIFCKPEESENEHKLLLANEEKLMQALKIPYRVVALCTGDIARPSVATFDIECWMPGQKQYRETHSCSNTTDFQARRLNIKYRTKKGKTDFVHMLNGTAFSMRPLIAIIENCQTKDGFVEVPDILRSYMGKEVIVA